MHPLVSIIVTTKNEEKNIANCLKSILGQTYKNIEIIVVDNFSYDRTKEIAKRYIDLVFDKGPERSAQRNYGMIDKSSGEYVMFIDADMILSPSLIEECTKAIIKNKCYALYIPEIVLGKSYFSQVRRFERSFYDGTVIDGSRFFIKDVFSSVGGFDETMSGPEDWDIDKKIKQEYIKSESNGVESSQIIGLLKSEKQTNLEEWPLLYFIKSKGINPNNYGAVIYHNEAEFNLKNYLKKKEYYAKSFRAYIKKWGKNDSDIKKQLGFFYRFFGVFFKNRKWKKIIVHPILTFGMYFLKSLVGFSYLFSL